MEVGLGAVGAFEEGQRLGAVLIAQGGQLLGDLVERLIPGDLLPLSAAALANALERFLQAVGVVLEVLPATLLETRAHEALVVRVVGVTLDVDDPAVLLGH